MAGTIEIGANVNISGYTFQDSFEQFMFDGGSNPYGAGTGQLIWRRSFTGSTLNPWSSSPAWIDRDMNIFKSWVSFKGDGTTAQDLESMIAGDYDSQILAFINTIPSGQEVLLTFYHEPENNTLDPARWREAQKHLHFLVTSNKGIHDIRTAIVLMSWSFDDISAPDHVDYIPVYAAGDAIPAGFAADDPAFDVFGIDFYSPGTGWYNRNWEAQSLPAGNPYGMVGYLQMMVDGINSYRVNPSFTLSDLEWACGEISGDIAYETDQDGWFADYVYGARDHPSTCSAICWFHNSGWPEFYMYADCQAWIKTNGNTFDGTPDPVSAGISSTVTYNVEAGTTLVNNDVGLEYNVDGLATSNTEILFDVSGGVATEVGLYWQTDQLLPILSDNSRTMAATPQRLTSGSPTARRPRAPGAEPA